MVKINGFDVPEYQEQGFLTTVRQRAVAIGGKGLEKVFLAYHVLRDPETPMKAKAVLGSALAYLVMPLDLVPDLVPVVGFSDDLAAISTALLAVAASVKPRHHEQARESVAGLLGKRPEVGADPS